MNSRFCGIFAALAAVTVFGACTEDPLADLRGGPASISINPNPLVVTEGQSATIEVMVRDEQLNGIPISMSVTAGSGEITVTEDNSAVDPTGVRRFYTVTGTAAAATAVNVAAGGLSRQGVVAVLPPAFHGTLSNTAPAVGEILTFTSAPPLDLSTATVNFGGGAQGIITAQDMTTLSVAVAQPDGVQPSPLTLEDVLVTGVPGLEVSIATVPVTITNPYDPNAAPNPATTITFPIEFYDGFKSTDADNFYSFTLGSETTVTFVLNWDTEADLDMFVCDAPCDFATPGLPDFLGGANVFDGASTNQPEMATMTLPAGTHNLYINAFDNHDDPAHSYKVTITIP